MNAGHSERWALVALPLAVPGLFTYEIPDTFLGRLQPGHRVHVSFGKRKQYIGIVIRCTHVCPEFQVKPILGLPDEQPLIQPLHIQFWEWMAAYYMVPVGAVMVAALPAAFRPDSETMVQKVDNWEDAAEWLTDQEFQLLEQFPEQQFIPWDSLKAPYTASMIQKWLDLGILMVEETLKEIILPKTALFVKLSDALLQDERLQHQALDQLKRSNAQLKLMAWLLSEPERGWMNRAELIRSFKGGEAAIRGLIKKNWLVQEKRSVETFEALAEENPSDHAKVELNADQQLALESLNQLLETKPAVLLHGVTGSGKTYVYARWIQELL